MTASIYKDNLFPNVQHDFLKKYELHDKQCALRGDILLLSLSEIFSTYSLWPLGFSRLFPIKIFPITVFVGNFLQIVVIRNSM